MLFYASPNRGVPYDSVTISANDVRATFSADTIGPGQVEHTRWMFATAAVIDIAVSFRYQVDPGGDIKAATTSFTCGGDESPAGKRERPPKRLPAEKEPVPSQAQQVEHSWDWRKEAVR